MLKYKSLHSMPALYIVFLLFFIAATPSSAEFPTSIDGQYYFRGKCPDGYEFCGTGYDVGQITRDAPREIGERNCGSWILFQFNPVGEFPSETVQQIDSILIHLWWHTDNGLATFGYDSSGSKGNQVDQSVSLSAETAVATANGYYLTVFRMDIQSEFGQFQGESIDNMTLKLFADFENPSIRSTPSQASFIIINPPSDTELQSMDSDNDGLSDYDELIDYSTDPFLSDTDKDGFSDFQESCLDDALSPVDPHDPPVFGRTLLQDITGDASCSNLGTAMTRLGDLDDDGIDEIAVGEPGLDRVWIFSYPFSPRLTIESPQPGTRFGSAVAAIRDSAGACIALAVGAPAWNDDSGLVYIFDIAGHRISTVEPLALGMRFGDVVVSLSDLNGDGITDFAVGSPGQCQCNVPGSVAVISGADGALLQQYHSASPGDTFGSAIAPFPDGPDPDDLPELLIGAPCDSRNNSTAGALYLFQSNGSLQHYWCGSATRTQLGCSVSAIGDYDGDNVADIAVSAPFDTMVSFPEESTGHLFNCGEIRVYSGRTYEKIITLTANTPGDWLGNSFCVIPDVDGDGLDDIAATTGRHRLRESTVVVLTSRNRLLWRCITRPSRRWLKISLLPINDTTGDGIPEFLLGLPNDRPEAALEDAGRVMLLTMDSNIPEYTSGDLDPDVYFTDPDGESLTYETIILRDSGNYRDVVIVATDPYGATASSNVFRVPGNSPDPTPTPPPKTGVQLMIPRDHFAPGDLFWMDAAVSDGGTPHDTVQLFVVLSLENAFFFWDTWTPVPNFRTLALPATGCVVSVISPFDWPDTASPYSELEFIGAAFDPDTGTIIGGENGLAYCSFSYGE